MDLTEFLLARIAEDEAAVQDWPLDGQWGLHSSGVMWQDGAGRPIYAPRARVLAECEAKRRIVSRCDMVLGGRGAGMFNDGQEVDAADNLRALAMPYADHEDYRPEWAVMR